MVFPVVICFSAFAIAQIESSFLPRQSRAWPQQRGLHRWNLVQLFFIVGSPSSVDGRSRRHFRVNCLVPSGLVASWHSQCVDHRKVQFAFDNFIRLSLHSPFHPIPCLATLDSIKLLFDQFVFIFLPLSLSRSLRGTSHVADANRPVTEWLGAEWVCPSLAFSPRCVRGLISMHMSACLFRCVFTPSHEHIIFVFNMTRLPFGQKHTFYISCFKNGWILIGTN